MAGSRTNYNKDTNGIGHIENSVKKTRSDISTNNNKGHKPSSGSIERIVEVVNSNSKIKISEKLRVAYLLGGVDAYNMFYDKNIEHLGPNANSKTQRSITEQQCEVTSDIAAPSRMRGSIDNTDGLDMDEYSVDSLHLVDVVDDVSQYELQRTDKNV